MNEVNALIYVFCCLFTFYLFLGFIYYISLYMNNKKEEKFKNIPEKYRSNS